ncbi:helix-turn-helix transcriptional regulator [Billgrantia sp. Q4P2]|uniref:helix-turn-helix transcriptional regulator n=1 Tax=Billgrantia sp. Q4P2 TaxID=3463857 RepID=UPI00405626FD
MSESSLLSAPHTQAGRGFDEFQARCGAYFDTFRISSVVANNDFRWCSNVKTVEGLTLGRIKFNAGWSMAQTDEKRGLNLLIPRNGGYEATLDKRQVSVRPGKLLLARTQQFRRIKIESNEMRPGIALFFDDSAVTKVLSSLAEDMAVDCLDIQPVLELSSQLGTALSGVAQFLERGAFLEQSLQSSPKAAALLIEAALTFIFENVPHRGSERIPCQVPLVAPRHVQEAVDFMRANLHQPLTMAEIAEATGVGVRSLQAAFRHFYGTTPMAHLRKLRLEAVHEELSSPVNRLSVGEVALKWGFLHMSRFAAQYRAAYGTYPSDTMAKAQRLL